LSDIDEIEPEPTERESNSMRSEIEAAVREFLGQANSGRTIASDELILERGILDSFGLLELVQSLEKRFGMALSDDDLRAENFATIGLIADLVERLIRKNSPSSQSRQAAR
jgi:acyl carrier protein